MSNNAQIAFNEMLPWFGALVFIVLVGGAVLFYLRHRLLATPESTETSRGFLDELRTLRDRGEISSEEYDIARLKMVARASGRDFDELKAESIRKAGGLVAEPGLDLLGRPLPAPTGGQPQPNEQPQEHSPKPPPKPGSKP